MRIDMIDPTGIPEDWEWLGPLLAPAVAYDPEHSLRLVKVRLRAGSITGWQVSGHGFTGVVVTRVEWDAGQQVCWLLYAAGQIDGGPKQVHRTMRRILTEIEGAAKMGGARELRIEGRAKWARLFSDYDVLWQDAGRVRMRKEL